MRIEGSLGRGPKGFKLQKGAKGLACLNKVASVLKPYMLRIVKNLIILIAMICENKITLLNVYVMNMMAIFMLTKKKERMMGP